MSLLVLNQQEVEELLDMEGCIEAMAEALSSLARGEVHVPLRAVVKPPSEDTFIGLMPAHRGGDVPLYSLKTVCVMPDNPQRGLDAHQGTVTLFDGETGETRAIMNASAITAIRTAAVSAVATRLLAREDARELGILGAGVQARSHLEALRLVRDFDRVRIYAPDGRARTGACGRVRGGGGRERRGSGARRRRRRHRDELRGAGPRTGVAEAGRAPQRDRRPSADDARARRRNGGRLRLLHRTSGSRPRTRLDDYRDALEAGAIGSDHIRGEIGEVLIGSAPGRQSPDELTVFRSLGLAVEDLAAAEYVVRRARERGVGVEVDF